ncbi:MAG: hypothetical protein WCV63_03685 [Negativicutes bacterium]
MKKTILVLFMTLLISCSCAALDLQTYNLNVDNGNYWLKHDLSPLKIYRDINFTRFSGVDTLLSINLNVGDTIRLVYDSTHSFGDMNIVVIDPAGKVYAKLMPDVMDSLHIVSEQPGVFKVKLIGDGVWWGHVRVRFE